MAAPKGNKYWQLADPDLIGRPRNFPTPQDLWNAAKEYFEWIDENPITTLKTTTTEKGVFVNEEKLQRPYTLTGLYVFLNVSNLKRYYEIEEFVPVLTHIETIIYSQKFEGASAGIFNSMIISRDLGLRDKQDVDHTTKGKKINMTPVRYAPKRDNDK